MKPKTPSAWAPLKGKLDRAKARLQSRTHKGRQQSDRLRYGDDKIERLEKEIAALRLLTTPQAVFNCHYPAQMMALAVFIVLHGGSLRCAAATAGFYAPADGLAVFGTRLQDRQ